METFVKKLIDALTKEEIRHIKLMAQKYKLDPDSRKDFQLIDYIVKKSDKYNDDEVAEILYGKAGKNSFYRLKNRVNDLAEKSLLEMNYGKDVFNQSLNYVQLYRHFYGKNILSIAIKYLDKAEKSAKQIQAFDLLEIVYTELIKLAYDLNTDPETYIEKRKVCREKMLELRQIDDVLALVKFKISTSQNIGKKDRNITDLLENTLKQVTGRKTTDNPELYFKIFESVSRILLNNNDYLRLESYLLKTHEECERLKLFNKQNHRVKLQLLTYLVNTFFKLNKYSDSLEFAQLLKQSLEEYDAIHRSQFVFYYYNSLANNYSVINKQRAVEYIIEGLEDKDIKKSALHTMYLYLQLCIQQFDLREYKNSLRSLQKIYINDQYTILDNVFQYKINIIECLNRYEIKDFDILEKNIKTIRKKFETEFEDQNMLNQYLIISLLQNLLKKQYNKYDQRTKQLVLKTLNNLADNNESNDLINYIDWIKSSFKV